MPYKNARITRSHLQRVTAKVWRLFMRWEASQSPVDYDLYVQERDTVDQAIKAAGVPAWEKEFILP